MQLSASLFLSEDDLTRGFLTEPSIEMIQLSVTLPASLGKRWSCFS